MAGNRTKLQKHRRSRLLPGRFEDQGKWYKCWNCGFIFDITKIGVGRGSGITITDPPYEDMERDDTIDGGVPQDAIQATIDAVPMFGTLIKTPLDGEIVNYYTPRKAAAGSGCAFCGTRNLP
jgi:hypothetical protein